MSWNELLVAFGFEGKGSLAMRNPALALGLFLACGMPLHAQNVEPRAIVEKAIKALGDEKVGMKLGTSITKGKGTLRLMGQTFDVTGQTWHALPGKTKDVVNLTSDGATIEIVEVINGDKGWSSFNGAVEDLDDDDMKEAKAMIHVEMVTDLFIIKTDKEIKLAPLGGSKVGDRDVVGVRATRKGQRDVSLYFDIHTDLLVKAEYRAFDPLTEMEVTQEKLFGGYKEFVPGFKSAAKITVKNDGELVIDMEITEIRLVERQDDAVFARPDSR
jgi:hypothetical protein